MKISHEITGCKKEIRNPSWQDTYLSITNNLFPSFDFKFYCFSVSLVKTVFYQKLVDKYDSVKCKVKPLSQLVGISKRIIDEIYSALLVIKKVQLWY